VRLLLDDGNTVIYGHLSRIVARVGQRIARGQILGYSGNTGNSTGPHLHMEVRRSSWDPATSWNFVSKLVPYSTTTSSTSSSSAPAFNLNKLKYRANNTEVRRFQQWLWSKQSTAYKAWFNKNDYSFT
jgi:murein DD-endopeptidase MepM/ murein hydrolase activator NlpD